MTTPSVPPNLSKLRINRDFPTAPLLRGRVEERIGERDLAIHSYSWVAGMWRNADPELQPYVTEAKEGLARLTGERP